MTTRWIARLFFPKPAIDFGPLMVLRRSEKWDEQPLPFVRWRDGAIVWPAAPELGAVVRSRPLPWKLGHGRERDGERWETRR